MSFPVDFIWRLLLAAVLGAVAFALWGRAWLEQCTGVKQGD